MVRGVPLTRMMTVVPRAGNSRCLPSFEVYPVLLQVSWVAASCWIQAFLAVVDSGRMVEVQIAVGLDQVRGTGDCSSVE